MEGQHGSWVRRASNRVRVLATHRLGLDPETRSGKTRIFVVAIGVALALLLLGSSTVFSDGEGTSLSSASSFSGGGMDAALTTNNVGGGGRSAFADDDDEDFGGGRGGGGGEEDGDEARGSGDEDEEDEEGGDGEREGRKSRPPPGTLSAADEARVAALAPKQLKLFQDKDKTLLKFFSKHRKETEVAAHFQMLQDLYKDLGLVKTTVIGTTYEKRNIIAYTIGRGKSGRAIMVTGTERADEWIGSMALAYFAMRLLQKYALTPGVTQVVEALQIHIVPVVNPDGLAYATSSSSKSHREWKMNRALNAEKKHGVDLLNEYIALSQLETQAVSKFAKDNAKSLYAFASVRCCKGAVRMPTLAKCASDNGAAQMDVATRIGEAMGKLGSYVYSVSSDPDDGSIPVFAYKDLGVALGFALDAHAPSKTTEPSALRSSDVLAASQNVSMGLMELAKFIMGNEIVDNGIYGGAGSKPCSSGQRPKSMRTAGGGDDGEEGAEDDEAGGGSAGRGGEDDEFGDEDDGGAKPARRSNGGEDEEDGEGDEGASAASASAEDDNVDHEAQFSQAADGSAYADKSGVPELVLSLSYTGAQGKLRPVLDRTEIPAEGSNGKYFLYFAYGPDMLYDVLMQAGLTSATKVVNGRLPGYTYDYTYHSNVKWKSGVADIVKSTHSAVYGVIWRLHVSQLAALESWQSASTPTSPLAKKVVQVLDPDGNAYTCVTFYVVRKSKGEDVVQKYHRFPPSRQYRNCVLKGAKQHHLPYDYVEHRLRSRSLAPLFTDKVGSTGHRNPVVGTVCDA